MLLKELLAGRMLPIGAADLAIRGLTADSREVRPGYLFAALSGTKADGAKFIPDAIAKGAAAILADNKVMAKAAVPIIHDANPRRALALMAARFFEHQPEYIAAVTGTNGKTSVATFARQIWSELGFKAANLGTLGAIGPDGNRLDEGAPLTTPDPVALHRLLDRLAGEGFDHVAFEASSHGLDQFRLDGVRIKAAAFTNLTRDHLDYHGTEEAYFAAKLRLFTEVLPPEGIAIVNVDALYGARVADAAQKAGRKVWRVGRSGREIRLIDAALHAKGQQLTVEVLDSRYDVALPLAGAFQASNALLSAGLVIACGGAPDRVVAALAKLTTVPGRMQWVGDALAEGGAGDQTASVYVDYAHTPDALRTVLEALRPHTKHRLHVVVGCGGDRDAGKRPLMGMLAAALADHTIITDDNPRSEVPAEIRREILEGVPDGTNVEEIGDRAKAIAAAVNALEPGDSLVIAGKGHETGQIVGKVTLPFDDADVARAAIAKRGRGT
ncbi:MAG: UDP-N-acetylmuramoyl-L-alanyl-D-glutamate--2,6-diaminopimelate ligase [Alphaproteobacteria bacterium]